MTRYIDAEKLDEQVKNKKPPYDMNSKAKEGFKTALLSIRSMIHCADVLEVKHEKLNKMTNAEKLAKDTEQLSDIINGLTSPCKCCSYNNRDDCDCDCKCFEGVRKWLESEAEEDDEC